MGSIKARPIRRLLIANRGEIATRIISSARELDIETYALYTDNDVGHTYNASHAVRLSSPAAYMSIEELLAIVRGHNIDAVHPGYGFLSESSQLVSCMEDADVMVVGPGAEILARTADKLEARRLAEACSVPVLPALASPTGSIEEIKAFASRNGLPIMIKAVDGGGGRGIRLVQTQDDIQRLAKRAIEESPSKQVFAESAAIGNYRHVEVQIIGDGNGNVVHLWERECSIQRRYQKLVELAPSTIADRLVVSPLIEAALKIAKAVNYASLGTFEFLLNPSTSSFYFLEINPRLQVEHTVTESICGIDIVKIQLRLAQGFNVFDCGLPTFSLDALHPPRQWSVQFRITAENPGKNYVLSIGKISRFHFPSGNGVRCDTSLVNAAATVVTSDFDSVLAKLIISAATWQDVVKKAQRALEDVRIEGVSSNINLLRAIAAHPRFIAGECDTQWLESSHEELMQACRRTSDLRDPLQGLGKLPYADSDQTWAGSASSMLFRRDDAWEISLQARTDEERATASSFVKHHLLLSRVKHNEFPDIFAADVLYTLPGQDPHPCFIEIRSTNSTASSLSSQRRRGNPSDKRHIILPISGKLIEVLVDVGDVVEQDHAICVIKQMKMELEVRSHRSGTVKWVTEAKEGEDVGEGMLAAIVDDDDDDDDDGRRAKL
ncbi:hypothetical protein K431DRAFT_249992 [Polychaeton citri CBS 116435]|uniref:Pyruvate carboxylase n=1 Tax=Polychaeton citri CBS 116435 TaxID=1314669 RepID=A0A9P4Q860_9PEZI|nr:hypothetical protein K431DRAFT_249992 [Polychaeton citri CBS 116435]